MNSKGFISAGKQKTRLPAVTRLPALSARDDENVKAAGEVSEGCGAFVIGMSGDVQDAGGNARAVDGFDSFWETWTGAGCGWKLRVGARSDEETKN